jgi:siroheme synthase (precorrin-2 oxidase/ferrochelatase)
MAEVPTGAAMAVGASALQQVRNVYGGKSVGELAAKAGGTGGEFRFTPELAQSVKAKFEAIRDDAIDDQERLRTIVRLIDPPSEDPSSRSFAESLRSCMIDARDKNVEMVAWLNDFLERLGAAIDSMNSAEDAHTDALRRTSSAAGGQ